jgi:hypothetical protein
MYKILVGKKLILKQELCAELGAYFLSCKTGMTEIMPTIFPSLRAFGVAVA